MKRTSKKSWDEEHVEFSKKAGRVKLGDKWRLGFYQVIRDKKLPETKIKDNSLDEFLVPEEHVSLKLFFDNLRNYAICAAFIALGSIVWARPSHLFSLTFPSWLSIASAVTIWVMAGLLLILNSLQTWILLTETYNSIRAIQISEFVFYRQRSIFQSLLSFFHVVLTWLLDISVRIGVLIFGISLILMLFGFVYYTVISTPGIQ